MKSYTDLEKSKVLSKILPLESADMFYNPRPSNEIPYMGNTNTALLQVPCWSLAALLGVLPIVYTNNKKEICGPLHIDITDSETPFVLWYVNPLHKGNIIELKTKEYDNLVDACYEMIMRLHELKML